MQTCAVNGKPGIFRTIGRILLDSTGIIETFLSKTFLQRTRVPPCARLFDKGRSISNLSSLFSAPVNSDFQGSKLVKKSDWNNQGSWIKTREMSSFLTILRRS